VAKQKSNPKPTLIIIGIAIVVILCMFVAQPVLAWISENKGILLASFFAVVVVVVALFIWWHRERLKKQNEAFYQLTGVIKALRYTPVFNYEIDYQALLYGYLIGKGYTNIMYEPRSGDSRPDLSVDGIAIEVKGPTGADALRTIADKAMKYSNHYHFLIAVLFDPYCRFSKVDETISGLGRIIDKKRLRYEMVIKQADY